MLNLLKAVLSSLVIACCLVFTVEATKADDVIKLSLPRAELNNLAIKRVDDRYLELTKSIKDKYEDNVQIDEAIRNFRVGRYAIDKDYNIKETKIFTDGLYKNLEAAIYSNFDKIYQYNNSWTHSNIKPGNNRVKIVPGTIKNDGPNRIISTFDVNLSKTWSWSGNSPNGTIIVKVQAEYSLDNDQLTENLQILSVELKNPKVVFVQTVSTISCNMEVLKEILSDISGTVSYSARASIQDDLGAIERQINELSHKKRAENKKKSDDVSPNNSGRAAQSGFKNEPDELRGIKWGQNKSDIVGLSKGQRYNDKPIG